MHNAISIFLGCVLLSAATRANSESATNNELLARVQQGDKDALLEAGKTGDKSFIPILEKMAKPRFVFHIDPERAERFGPQLVDRIQKSQAHPVYDELPA